MTGQSVQENLSSALRKLLANHHRLFLLAEDITDPMASKEGGRPHALPPPSTQPWPPGTASSPPRPSTATPSPTTTPGTAPTSKPASTPCSTKSSPRSPPSSASQPPGAKTTDAPAAHLRPHQNLPERKQRMLSNQSRAVD
jgi:hypothetical protein